jgi:hypothetical protein
MIALLGGKGADIKFCFRRQGGTSLHQLFVTLDKFIAATGQRSLQLK